MDGGGGPVVCPARKFQVEHEKVPLCSGKAKKYQSKVTQRQERRIAGSLGLTDSDGGE